MDLKTMYLKSELKNWLVELYHTTKKWSEIGCGTEKQQSSVQAQALVFLKLKPFCLTYI